MLKISTSTVYSVGKFDKWAIKKLLTAKESIAYTQRSGKMKKTLVSILLIIVLAFGGYSGYKIWRNNSQEVGITEVYQLLVVSGKTIDQTPLSTDAYEKLSTKKYISETMLKTLGFLMSHDEEENCTSLVSYDTLMRYDMDKGTLTYDGVERPFKNSPFIINGERYFDKVDFEDGLNVGWYINDQRKILMALDNMNDYSKASVVEGSGVYKVVNDVNGDRLQTLDVYSNLFIGDIVDGWAEIVTEQLVHGYVQVTSLSESKLYQTILHPKKIFDYRKEPINLTWEAVYSKNPNVAKIPEMTGLNVISPTWMSLANEEGRINKKLISSTYTEWAHARGYEVWPLISNDFKPERTSKFLHSAKARQAFIDELLSLSLTNNFDGINIDFENVFLEDKDALSQFVAELSQTLRQHDLTVSMDVTVIGGSDNWSRCYDRASLGQYVDYLMIMAYDQYWASSPTSGPVAAYDWVSTKMNEIIKVVPAHKVVLGMPTYMRIWREVPSTEKANVMKAKSETLSMNRLVRMMDEKDFNFIWDETGQHYYIGYIEDNILTKIWIENGKSIRAKTAYARENELAGVATWRRGFETQDIWGIIEEELNK